MTPRRGSIGTSVPGWGAGLLLAVGLLVSGCAPNMSEQPKYKGLRASDFFQDGRSARPLVEGTVAREMPSPDEVFYTGRVQGELVAKSPVPVTRELLERGHQRFDIFCAPCHSRLGDGEGMVVLRGFQRAASYHVDRLREAPDGHFFDVITHGYGAMAGYAARIEAGDRWAITAYIRALQLSQDARVEDVPEVERRKLTGETK